MDGNAEDLVAIVQSPDATGVTLTFSNRPRHNVERRRPSRQRLHINASNISETSPVAAQRLIIVPAVAERHAESGIPAVIGKHTVSGMPAPYKASTETNTGADYIRTNKGSQICDDRYTSSYKMAHCQITPTSPPEAVSEFPPQRKEPCRNQGNFEIGGNGSAQWSYNREQGTGQGVRQACRSAQVRGTTSRIRHNGGSQIWRDRGSTHRYCNSKRDIDAFEHSLRKYPNISPFRTASTDLIEKLIRYTQAKNFQEMSRSTKSVRSLRQQNTADTNDLSSKHQQTYTRNQNDKIPGHNSIQVGYQGRRRNFKLYSPISDTRNLRNRESVFSNNYDYLKAGGPPDGQCNNSDGSPSPNRSRSPEDSRSPTHSPVRFGSPTGAKSLGGQDTSRHPDRPFRFERSVRDLSLSEMSKYIRTTVKQMCNERTVVFQVCPKLKNRYNLHKRVCPSLSERPTDLIENEEDTQASGSVLSRIIQTFSRWPMPLTEQTGCQCNKTDCYCTRATQCAFGPEISTNTVGCSCRTRTIDTKTSCDRSLTCVCTDKTQNQAYYNKKIDEVISQWLKEDVPVHSIENETIKRKRGAAIKKLREALKQLPDEDFDTNVKNEINSFIVNLPLWNPGKDKEEATEFRNQLAEKLIDEIVAIPRKPDRFRDIITKWVNSLDFMDDNDEIERDTVIDNFVNILKSLAAERPMCDMKYLHILKKEIIGLLDQLPLNYDRVMSKRKAHQLAREIVNLPRNIKLSGDTDAANAFQEEISEWICEHGLCRELKKDPKLIEGLANKLKSQGMGDEELVETMRELISEFVDDFETAVGILDEFVDELVKPISSASLKTTGSSTDVISVSSNDVVNNFSSNDIVKNVSANNVKRFDPDGVSEIVTDWLAELPGASDFRPSKFKKIAEDIIEMIQDCSNLENEHLQDDIFEYIIDANMPIDPANLHNHIEELLERVNVLPPSEDLIEMTKRKMVKGLLKAVDITSLPEEQQNELKKSVSNLVTKQVTMASLHSLDNQENVKRALIASISQIISKMNISIDDQEELKAKISNSLSTNFYKSFTRLGNYERNLKHTIEKDVRQTVDELPIDTGRKKDLLGQIHKTLSKHMNKPLNPRVKNIITDNISDIFEKCPISEDRSFCGRLKKGLFDVVEQTLDMFLPIPVCVCDCQCKLENDLSEVIDSCSIVRGHKIQCKECVHDILTKNGDRLLSNEAVKTIQEEINSMCDDLPIPKDKKESLKKAVRASLSESLNDPLLNFSHDINKLRKKLLDNMTDVIERFPITRDLKTQFKNQIKPVVLRNLDSTLSNDEKRNILDDVTDILKHDLTEARGKNLSKKLSGRINASQWKEPTEDLTEMITEDVEQLVKRLSIDADAKEDLKKEIQGTLLDTLINPLTEDIQETIVEDILREIDDMDIPQDVKNVLKSNLEHALKKELKLIANEKELPEIETALQETIRKEMKDLPISKHDQNLLDRKLHNVLDDNLVRNVTNQEQEAVRKKLDDIVDDLKIDKGQSEALKAQLLNDANKYFKKSAHDRMQPKGNKQAPSKSDYQKDHSTPIKVLEGLENSMKLKEKQTLKNHGTKNLSKPVSFDPTELYTSDLKATENKTKQKVVKGLETAVDEAPIPKEKKTELKEKLKNFTTQQFKNELSDIAPVAFKHNMDDIIDEMNLPKNKKDILKNELNTTVDDNLSNLRRKTKSSPKETKDLKPFENETKGNIVRGLETTVDEAPIPKEKKTELKKKLKDLTTQQFRNEYPDRVPVAFKHKMDDIIDEMNLPKDKKNNLKSELTATVDDNLSNLRTKPKSSKKETKDLKPFENETKGNIVRGLETTVDEAPIPKEKKTELKKKLKDLTTQQLRNEYSDRVPVAFKHKMDDIIDEMNLPKDKKNNLKSELTATVDDNLSNLRTKPKSSQKETKDLKSFGNETKGNIVRGLETTVDEAPIPKEKKTELKKKLKDLTTQQFRNEYPDRVPVAFKHKMDDIIDEMNLPKDNKNNLKSELTATVDDNLSNFRSKPKSSQKETTDFKSSEKETKGNIVRGLETAVDEAPIPKEKKTELKKKLKDLTTKQLKNQLTDDVAVVLKDDMDEIIDEMNLPRDKNKRLKSDLNATLDQNMNDMQRKIKDGDKKYFQSKPKSKVSESETSKEITDEDDIQGLQRKTLRTIIQGHENVIDKSKIPKELKQELKKKMKDIIIKHFMNPVSNDIVKAIKDDLVEVIDELNLPKDQKTELKIELIAAVDKHVNDLLKKLKERKHSDKKTESTAVQPVEDTKVKDRILQRLGKVIENSAIPENKKRRLTDVLEIITSANLKKRLSNNDLEQQATTQDLDFNTLNERAISNILLDQEKIIGRAKIPKELRNELKTKLKELTTEQFKKPITDDTAQIIKNNINKIINDLDVPEYLKDELKMELNGIVDENINNLLKQLENLKRKPATLRKKQQETDIDPRLKDILDKYGINPSYQKQLSKELDNLMNIVQQGGDLEDARKKLIKKLMQDLNLSEAEATALADKMIARAQEKALADKKAELKASKRDRFDKYGTDPNYEDQSGEEFEKLQGKARKGRDFEGTKTDLNKKLMRDLNISESEANDLANKMGTRAQEKALADNKNQLKASLRDLFDKYGIDPSYEDQLAKEFQKLLEKARKGGDLEDAKKELIKKLMRDLNLSKAEATALANEMLARAKQMVSADKANQNKEKMASKYEKDFAQAISDAVDESTAPNDDKPILKDKLLNKLKQVLDKKPFIRKSDIGPLKSAVLKECNKTVDESSLPTDKKNELKTLLKEKFNMDFKHDDKGEEDALGYKDKIKEIVKKWMNSLPTHLDSKIADTVADSIASDILDRHRYLQVHPEAKSSDKAEIENLKYQVFRRMNKFVDPKVMPQIMEKTPDLYNMIMKVKKELDSQQEQVTSTKRRRNPSPQETRKTTNPAFSAGNIDYSLKELIAATRGVRKQWTKDLDDAISKIPCLKYGENIRNTLVYDVTGHIDKLSTGSKSIAKTGANHIPKPKKQVVLKTKNKSKSGLTKTDEAFTFNNTTKQNSPFKSSQKPIEKDERIEKMINDAITNWLDKIKVNIAPKEKKKAADDLVSDLIEWQKYIQDFGITLAHFDNSEFLKFQVQKRLNKLVPADILKTILENMGELIAKIESILQQKPQRRLSTRSPSTSSNKSPSTSSNKSPVPKKKQTKQKNTNQTTSSDTTDTSANDVPRTAFDGALEHGMTNTEFSPGLASTPNKTAAEEHMDKVTESISNWMESVPINLEPDLQVGVINDLANDVIDRQKYLQIHPEKMISKKEEIENLRFQVFKRLKKESDNETLTPDIDKIEELYKKVNGDGRRKNLTPQQAQEFLTTLPDEIAAVLNDYNICCERRELLSSLTDELSKLRNSNADQDEIIENLIETIKRITYLSDCTMCDDEAEDFAYKLLARTKKLITRIQSKGAPIKKKDFRDAIMQDIGDVFYGCPMSDKKRRLMECQLVEDYAKDLGIPLDESETTVNDTAHYGMSFNGLTNFIDTWLSSIHTEDDDTKDESEINDMKKDMANSLTHKIGEMNIDPEIFNDDALYEAVLREELQNMLDDITITDEDIETMKEDLIHKVLEAKQRAHEEFAGQAYKRKLRDTISKVLPEQRNLSKEDYATLNTLKDQLADAYIDLHFSGNNEPLREKLKRKISNELNRFCRNYMNRVPCAPLSSQKLNQALYDALNGVPLPAKDSIRYEVEQARIREEINDWLKELPLQPQNPSELQARNKAVYVLAKKLFDIEKEGNDEENDTKRGEIVKFLNKLPLETEEEIETLADTLINILVATEESRKYNPLSNVTLDSFGNVSTAVCPGLKSLLEKRRASPGPSDSHLVCTRPPCKPPMPMPPCTLTPEDKEYLDRIRRRTRLTPGCVKSILKDDKPKTCPGPRPVDAGSQTMLRPLGYQRPQSPICRIDSEKTPKPCPGRSAKSCSQERRVPPCAKDKPQRAPVCLVPQEKTAIPCPETSRLSSPCVRQSRRRVVSSTNLTESNEEVQPQIIIKKYYWNANEKNSEEEMPKIARGNRAEPPLGRQADQTPCEQIRKSSYSQCTPPLCHRSSSGKLHQQDAEPQRVPCEFFTRPTSCPDPKCLRQPTSSSYNDPPRPTNRDMSSSRTSCAPHPCLNPFYSSNQPQNSPPCWPFSKRDNECRIPKRDNECRIPKRDGLDHHDQMPCSSSGPYRKERVIELGSLDDICSPRTEKRRDANDWHEEEEEDNCWFLPIRRVILDEGIDDSVVMERDKRDEKARCKCKARLTPKTQTSRSHLGRCPSQQFMQGNEDEQNSKKCAKCCGRRCPYPSYLYFRQ